MSTEWDSLILGDNELITLLVQRLRTLRKWPVLCRVGRWTLLTHSLMLVELIEYGRAARTAEERRQSAEGLHFFRFYSYLPLLGNSEEIGRGREGRKSGRNFQKSGKSYRIHRVGEYLYCLTVVCAIIIPAFWLSCVSGCCVKCLDFGQRNPVTACVLPEIEDSTVCHLVSGRLTVI